MWGRLLRPWSRKNTGGPAAGVALPLNGMSLAGMSLAGGGLGGLPLPGMTPARRLDNPVAHRCLSLIARSVAAVPWLLYEGDNEVTQHPALDLLRQPAPGLGRAPFVELLAQQLVLWGEVFVLPVGVAGLAPVELLAATTAQVKRQGSGAGRVYEAAGRRWLPEEIAHLRRLDPFVPGAARGDLPAASRAIDAHEAALRWNEALLQNGARPSLALVYDPKEGPQHLSEEQFTRLKAELKAQTSGHDQAGAVLLLDGGLSAKELSLSPKDMDWLAGRRQAALEIATAFGVPAQLIGIPDAQTYANMEQARLAFWEDSVLPLLSLMQEGLGQWLLRHWPGALRFAPDEDAVPALVERRLSLFEKLSRADFLTADEKRAAVGYRAMG